MHDLESVLRLWETLGSSEYYPSVCFGYKSPVITRWQAALYIAELSTTYNDTHSVQPNQWDVLWARVKGSADLQGALEVFFEMRKEKVTVLSYSPPNGTLDVVLNNVPLDKAFADFATQLLHTE